MDQTSILVAVARHYYQENLSQQEIADRLNVSRSLVAQYIKKAREQGIVRIEVVDPRDDLHNTSLLLQIKLGLKHVSVTPTLSNSPELTLAELGVAVADYLDKILRDGDVLGFSWGRTLARIAHACETEKPRRIEVVPLLGESGHTGSFTQLSQIVLQVAQAFGGTPYFLHAPVLVDSEDMRNLFMQDGNARGVVARWEQLNVVCLGIGTVPPIPGQVVYVGEEHNNRLAELGAVGDICARFFNQEGEFVQTDFSDCLLGADIKHLRKADEVVAVAAGAEKAKATLGALRSGLISTLFVDEALARILVEQGGVKHKVVGS
jgi:DNA-binding transcriptional regulator LsrR (DeoR family)